MRKSDFTKSRIIIESSNLFNTQGYKSTSLSEITEASGYTKGAIYRHFENKEALEIESLEYMSKLVLKTLSESIKKENNVFDKLNALFDFFCSYTNEPIIKGGCPLLNAAIEVDETETILKFKAKTFLNAIKISINKLLLNGIKYNQLKSDLDVEAFSTVIIASLEGAIMMSKLSNTNTDLRLVTKHLKNYIESYRK
ncbi:MULTISPECIES: TetR/AcrR family transcriptional regulator [Flavobacterium]|uniref:TetR/AcrR family transcriptional regulator n=1 Tax=Flavobacterium jumunjinense TaxID=998845 RepID=A0ABV5GN71_9FLAO|nr:MULTISPECIES: TetR/AcrR family transcriptional regulator [Flavobacterium]